MCVAIIHPAVGVGMTQVAEQWRPHMRADPLRLHIMLNTALQAERGEAETSLHRCDFCHEIVGDSDDTSDDTNGPCSVCLCTLHTACCRELNHAMAELALEVLETPSLFADSCCALRRSTLQFVDY